MKLMRSRFSILVKNCKPTLQNTKIMHLAGTWLKKATDSDTPWKKHNINRAAADVLSDPEQEMSHISVILPAMKQSRRKEDLKPQINQPKLVSALPQNQYKQSHQRRP